MTRLADSDFTDSIRHYRQRYDKRVAVSFETAPRAAFRVEFYNDLADNCERVKQKHGEIEQTISAKAADPPASSSPSPSIPSAKNSRIT